MAKAASAASATVETDDALKLLPAKYRDRSSLKVEDLSEITGLTIAAIYKNISLGKFPPAVKFGSRSIWPTTLVAEELSRRLSEATERQRQRVADREAASNA